LSVFNSVLYTYFLLTFFEIDDLDVWSDVISSIHLAVASIRPKSEIEIGRNFPEFWALVPQFLSQIFLSILGFFPLYAESCVKA